MKLKKIASLMLAGIMAVSMLAACGEGNNINKNPGSSSSEPTVANVVSAVEGGIKRHNPNLTITVKSSPTLDQRIEKLFATASDYKDNEGVIVEHLKDVFGIADRDLNVGYADFMDADVAAYIADHGSTKDDDRDTLWGYAYIKVTNDDDAFVTAGNVIGKAFADAGFSNKIDEIGATDVLKGYAVNYTLYVCGDETVTFNGDTNSYVVAVLKASYSDTSL